MDKSITYLHALHLAGKGEPKTLLKNLGQYDSPEAAWEHLKVATINPDDEFKKLERLDIWAISKDSLHYPPLLRETHDAPVILYGRGVIDPDQFFLAMVGTRKPTEYGKTVAKNFAADFAQAGISIVSGGAYGIDKESHAGALRSGGKTIMVIGSGLDRASFYPGAHWNLAEEIVQNGGAVISEYPPGTKVLQHHFPERNRIIAGMSRGLIVVEAQMKSGASITARLAVSENRDVFVVPGSIYSPTSDLPNSLLKEGAAPLLAPSDLLEAYGFKLLAEAKGETFGEFETVIIEALRNPCTLDDLSREVKGGIHALQSSLTALELAGKIMEIEPGRYQVIGS
ncbi:MAG: DNA-protecting protein DprA [Candidatus Sungbacteria bacterium]|uniref:DNA-protecting protein DprA n=1 Tax=Candidatus Sungiibacteriota bacterium TaxID=2750080 RepID=A0A9D6LTD1_9BACT|nr:DNA-protecting protein DprA [Candidatus Sungbacteria bacterium]